MRKEEALGDVIDELEEATSKFGPMLSPHEGLAIILEEYEELKEEIFKPFNVRQDILMRKEAKHVAAMAIRFMMDQT